MPERIPQHIRGYLSGYHIPDKGCYGIHLWAMFYGPQMDAFPYL